MSLSSRPSHLLDLLSGAHHALLIFKEDRDYGERVLSTQTLRAEAERVAAGLAARGVGPGDEVTLLLSQPVYILSCFWACVMLGASPLIAPVEHDLLARLCAVLPAQRVIVDQIMEQTSRSMIPASFEVINASTLARDARHTAWHTPESSHHTALRVASFEATEPRILALSHHNVLSTLVQHVTATQLTSQSILVSWMPLSCFSALCAGHFAALLQHAGHVLLSPYTYPDDPLLWLHTLHQHRATHAIASRAVTSLVYHHIEPADLNDLDLSSLVSLWLGPEPLSSRDTYELCHLLGRAYVKPTVMQTGYAIAQGALATTISSVEESLSLLHMDRHALAQGRVELTSARSQAIASLSMGRPVVGCSVRIVSAEGTKLPELTPGEVVISGPGVPTRDGEKWHHTDTIGFMHDGALHILGQRSDRYTIQGHTLYACDLESIVEHNFFSLDGPVAAIAYATHDQDAHLLLLVCCPLDGDELAEELAAIRAHLQQVLPQGCAEERGLSILPISASDHPHRSTHQVWRQVLRHALLEGQFDLQLATHDLPYPRHRRGSPARLPATSRTPQRLHVSLDKAHIDALIGLLQGAEAPVTLALELDPSGALRQVELVESVSEKEEDHTVEMKLDELPTGDPSQTPHKETLLAFPEPPASHTQPMFEVSSARHVASTSELDEPQDSSAVSALEQSLEEDTQQLWMQERSPTATPPPQGPYKSHYPTRPMVGISPQAMIPTTQIQAPFLVDIVPPEVGWIEVVLALPAQTREEALHQAIADISARHEALRMHLFEVEGGAPLQHVQPGVTQPLEFHDLSTLSQTHAYTRTSQIVARFRATMHEPKYQRALTSWLAIREGSGLSLYLLVHHTVLDERAARHLLAEIEALIAGKPQEHRSSLAPLAAAIRAHHAQINANEYWTTLFARPYRPVSLRDATFPYERRALSMLLEREKLATPVHDLEAALMACFVRFIAEVSPVEADSLIISVPHDWAAQSQAHERPIYALTSPLPVRVTLPDEHSAFEAFLAHVRQRLDEAHRHALTPEHIARAANTSRLVASGTRFVFRWRAHEPGLPELATHHDALVAYPSSFLNELCLDCVEQSDGDVMLTLHIGEDVQMRHPTMRVLPLMCDALLSQS